MIEFSKTKLIFLSLYFSDFRIYLILPNFSNIICFIFFDKVDLFVGLVFLLDLLIKLVVQLTVFRKTPILKIIMVFTSMLAYVSTNVYYIT